MIVHYYNNSIFVIFFIYSILGKRFLLSTVLVVFSTDTEMLFSVAGFQTFQPYNKKKKSIISIVIVIYIHMLDLELGALRGLTRGVNLYWLLKNKENRK